MTNQQHPITPPPELVQQWVTMAYQPGPSSLATVLATQAVQWGADQELEASEAWIRSSLNGMLRPANRIADDLRSARRPKPPSLKEQALGLLNEGPVSDLLDHEVATIRRALEALPND